MPVKTRFIAKAISLMLLATSCAMAPAYAGPLAPFDAPQRPSPAGPGAIGLVATLGAIIEAELAAKEQKSQATTNPFLKPRPRPNREHIAAPKAEKPAASRALQI